MSAVADRSKPAESAGFLDLLGAPGREPIDCSHVIAVFAHPDDETIAIGGQLRRLSGIRVLHVTDGAPANMADAQAHGFADCKTYATARRRELEAAVGRAGVPPEALLRLDVADQAAARAMPMIARKLSDLFRDHAITVVITHAFEGGHPDHDATAFAVHAACALLEGEGLAGPEIIECPFYHVRGSQWLCQQFARADGPEYVIELDGESARQKRQMLSAYATQQGTLARFRDNMVERFRRAPRYDFARLPNGGELLYEGFDWGLDGRAWLGLAEEARRELGLPRWS